MTIDEKISYAREVCENCRKEYEKYAKFNPQAGEHFLRNSELYGYIAEILEELKELRYKNGQPETEGYPESYHRGFYDGYEKAKKKERNKAIDDFVEKISESNQGHWRVTRYEHGEAVSETMSYDIGTIKLIAEQLKAGGKDA